MGRIAPHSAFGLIFDNLLGWNIRQTRGQTMLFALLYESLLFSDAWSMTNASLQQLLFCHDGVELLRSGVLVPVRRDSVPSFVAFRQQAEDKKMHGLCGSVNFATFLDARVGEDGLTFPMKEVGASYVSMSARVLQPDFLISLGVSEEGAEKVGQTIRDAQSGGVPTNTNTFVKDAVCPLLADGDAVLVMDAARAPYSVNLPSVLGTGIVGPEGFRGDQILAALRGATRKTASISVTGAGGVVDAAFKTKVGDALVNWLLSSFTLETMTAEEIAAARSTSERPLYLLRLSDFLSTPNNGTWIALVAVLSHYLGDAAKTVFEMRRRAGGFGLDVADEEAEVIVEGGNTITIRTPGKPVELSEMAAASTTISVEELQVIGKPVDLPVSDRATQPD